MTVLADTVLATTQKQEGVSLRSRPRASETKLSVIPGEQLGGWVRRDPRVRASGCDGAWDLPPHGAGGRTDAEGRSAQ